MIRWWFNLWSTNSLRWTQIHYVRAVLCINKCPHSGICLQRPPGTLKVVFNIGGLQYGFDWPIEPMLKTYLLLGTFFFLFCEVFKERFCCMSWPKQFSGQIVVSYIGHKRRFIRLQSVLQLFLAGVTLHILLTLFDFCNVTPTKKHLISIRLKRGIGWFDK